MGTRADTLGVWLPLNDVKTVTASGNRLKGIVAGTGDLLERGNRGSYHAHCITHEEDSNYLRSF